MREAHDVMINSRNSATDKMAQEGRICKLYTSKKQFKIKD